MKKQYLKPILVIERANSPMLMTLTPTGPINSGGGGNMGDPDGDGAPYRYMF